MQNTTEAISNFDNITLNNDYLLFECEELVLKHFKELSEDIADALFIADVTQTQLTKIAQPVENQLKTVDNLSEEIDSIFSKHKLKIIQEVSKSVAEFVADEEMING